MCQSDDAAGSRPMLSDDEDESDSGDDSGNEA